MVPNNTLQITPQTTRDNGDRVKRGVLAYLEEVGRESSKQCVNVAFLCRETFILGCIPARVSCILGEGFAALRRPLGMPHPKNTTILHIIANWREEIRQFIIY